MSKRVAGIDIGSGTTKCVVLDEDFQVVGSASLKTSPDFDATARAVLAEASGAVPVDYVATTGLGRYSVEHRQIQITEITCATKAAHHAAPDAHFILDVGAQSTRAVRKTDQGKVAQFRSNEKCAAGSGGFLERAAKYLEVTVEELGTLSMDATTPQAVPSVCAVLAESEIINHVSEGRSVPDIVRGIHMSLAERSLMLLKRVGTDGPVILLGGVARQPGMVAACREVFGPCRRSCDASSSRTAPFSASWDAAPGRRSAGDSAWRSGTRTPRPAPSWSVRRLETL